jgi:hypothetical protein
MSYPAVSARTVHVAMVTQIQSPCAIGTKIIEIVQAAR